MISADKRSPIQWVDHRSEAARLRKLANSATTEAIKARLLEQARQHEPSPRPNRNHRKNLDQLLSLLARRCFRRVWCMMNGDWQSRIDMIRQYVATGAGGISIGAAVMIVVPIEIMRVAVMENTNQAVARKTAILAVAVSLAARGMRITIRRK